jgi:hypothetical protein
MMGFQHSEKSSLTGAMHGFDLDRSSLQVVPVSLGILRGETGTILLQNKRPISPASPRTWTAMANNITSRF